MQLGPKSTVRTPYEDPSTYDPDWRNRVAVYLKDCPEALVPLQLSEDPYVLRQSSFLRSCAGTRDAGSQSSPLFFERDWKHELQAYNIHRGADSGLTRDYLEALLLTEQDIGIIAADLNCERGVIDYYEQVYWSCRPDTGTAPEMVRTWFALRHQAKDPNLTQTTVIWKLVAASMGYDALTAVWGWKHPAGRVGDSVEIFKSFTRTNIGRMIMMASRGDLEPVDINSYFSQHVGYERLQHDIARGGHRDEYADLVLNVLNVLAPSMSELAQSGEALRLYEEGAANMLSAESAITASDSGDRGAQTARRTLNDRLYDKLSPLGGGDDNEQETVK